MNAPTKTKVTDAEFVNIYLSCGSNAPRTAQALDLNVRTVHARLAKIEQMNGQLVRNGRGSATKLSLERDTRPNSIELLNGTILVGSDAHYWPGSVPTTAHRALVKVAKKLQPDIVVMNGDEFDGAKVSRHGPIGWERAPDAYDELLEVQARLQELRRAAPNADHLGTWGNHTLRFDTYLASHAANVRGIFGTRIEDHLPGWNYRWAWIVNGHTLIKHRIRGGVHATWNNTADAHVSTVTGHTHSLQVRPRTTMSPVNNGTIYGVDTGMLADPWGPQFGYAEQGPRNWRSGFAVLTFKEGILMPPELAQVTDRDKVFFRGELLSV